MWILVVEDEASLRQALRKGLEEENHTVTVAADGLEGILNFRGKQIPVLISNVRR